MLRSCVCSVFSHLFVFLGIKNQSTIHNPQSASKILDGDKGQPSTYSTKHASRLEVRLGIENPLNGLKYLSV